MCRARILCSVVLVAVGLLAAACGNDDEGGIGGVTCESNCERRLAAHCSQTPSDFRASCTALCEDARQKVSEQCHDELNAAYACVAEKVKYSCDSRGFMITSPAPGAACESQAAACTQCSGNVVECNRL